VSNCFNSSGIERLYVERDQHFVLGELNFLHLLGKVLNFVSQPLDKRSVGASMFEVIGRSLFPGLWIFGSP
jgi:hypothetical protein